MKQILCTFLACCFWYSSCFGGMIIQKFSSSSFTCGTTADYSYTSTDSWVNIGTDQWSDGMVGVVWETSQSACSIEFWTSVVGDVDAIDYEAIIISIDASDDMDSTIATSTAVSGEDVTAGGWTKFEFDAAYALEDRAIVISRTDSSSSSSSNYIRVNVTWNTSTDMDFAKYGYTGTNSYLANRAAAVRIYDAE